MTVHHVCQEDTYFRLPQWVAMLYRYVNLGGLDETKSISSGGETVSLCQISLQSRKKPPAVHFTVLQHMPDHNINSYTDMCNQVLAVC
jgi:hypothetical protein